MKGIRAEKLAKLFHSHYENLAPVYGYSTRGRTRIRWENVPEPNKSLMIATARAVLKDVTEACKGCTKLLGGHNEVFE